jgi:hypothetical protein
VISENHKHISGAVKLYGLKTAWMSDRPRIVLVTHQFRDGVTKGPSRKAGCSGAGRSAEQRSKSVSYHIVVVKNNISQVQLSSI